MEEHKKSPSSTKQINKPFGSNIQEKNMLSSYTLPRMKKSISTIVVNEVIKVSQNPINDIEDSKNQETPSNEIKALNINSNYLSTPTVNEMYCNDNEIINLKCKVGDSEDRNDSPAKLELRKNDQTMYYYLFKLNLILWRINSFDIVMIKFLLQMVNIKISKWRLQGELHQNKIETGEQTQKNKVVTILKKNYSQPIIVSSRVQTQHKRSSQFDRLSKPDSRNNLPLGCWRG